VRISDDGPVGLKTTGDAVEEVQIEIPRRRRVRAACGACCGRTTRARRCCSIGALGLVACLAVETIGAMIVLGQGFVDAFYGAAKTLVTVDPNDEVADGPKAFKLFISATMLTALVFEALFTAGIVNRLIDRRLTGIVGDNAVPRRDHVVVVGMGQVGLRLCELLRRCGVGVVAVDHHEEGENVGTAKEAGLPVVIGRGADPSLLKRLSLERALALAAVTNDDLQNVSIAMAARSLNEDLRIVLRAGDGQLANETRSLFRLGLVRDVHRIAAALLAAKATGSRAGTVICHEDEAQLLHEDGRIEKAAISAAA
jgi:Trk K+ transport system NAD-binding subunit